MLLFAGCILIISASTAAGAYMSSQLRSKCEELKKSAEIFEFISIYLISGSYDSAEIFSALRERFPGAVVLQADGIDRTGLSGNLVLKLKTYFEKFGSSDLDSLLSMTGLMKKELESEYLAAKEKYEKNGRLYRVMGLCAGSMLALMII